MIKFVITLTHLNLLLLCYKTDPACTYWVNAGIIFSLYPSSNLEPLNRDLLALDYALTVVRLKDLIRICVACYNCFGPGTIPTSLISLLLFFFFFFLGQHPSKTPEAASFLVRLG